MNISLDIRSVSGTLSIPPSKSMMQRICAAAYLHRGRTTIINPGISEDDQAAVEIIRQMGALVDHEGEGLVVTSSESGTMSATINCSESGLSARLFTPIAALHDRAVLITGEGSLPKRPMHFFADILPALGVQLPGFSGYIPFTVQGPLLAKDCTVSGKLSSQFISGLLFAFTAAATEKISLGVDDLVSKPYIDLSLQVLQYFGKPVRNIGYHTFIVDPSLFTHHPQITVTVEGDWSSASFWIAAASLSGALVLRGLSAGSRQADQAIVSIIQSAGGQLHWENDLLSIRSAALTSFEADFTDCPDLFPVMAVLAACCKGRSVLKGVHRLIYKESNRAESICTLLSLLQVTHTIENDLLIIEGKESFPAFSYAIPHDHRMAMAATLASLWARGPVTLTHTEAVDKSYPLFWSHVRQYCIHC
jgi:3-phosphoshikimate 1-carboxyvinyltransferase